MKVAVLGAGGIGGYVGGRLQEAGHKVSFTARGTHLAALQTNGLTIESPLGSCRLPNVHATSEIDDIGPVDLILVTVKMPDLAPIASEIPKLLSSQTRIVTLQNGIDAKPVLAKHVDPKIVAQGIIYLVALIKNPGVIMSPGGKHQMLVDALDGDVTMQKFFAAIEGTVALDVTPVDDGDLNVWQKFAAQSAIAAVTALTRQNLGGVFSSPNATELLQQLMQESVDVAAACGIELDDGYVERLMSLYAQQPPSQSSSLILDILAGKPSELAYMSGRIHQLGQSLGVATPAHSVAWNALAAYADGHPSSALPV